jgi:putative phage-type endonuclease
MSTIDRTAWHAERARAIGASEVPSIFGVGFQTPYELWARKTGRLAPTDETEAMEIGTLLQSPICELVRRRTTFTVTEAPQDTFLRHPIHSFLGCTPDGRVFDPAREDDGIGALETKNVGHYFGKEWEQGIPLPVQCQMQCQLEVTGYRWGVAAGLIGGNKLRWHVIERDEAFIAFMVEKVREFWWHVQEDIAPPVDGSEATRRAIHDIHPKDNGATVDLGKEFDDAAEEIEALDRVIKDAETRRTELQNKVKLALGDNTFGLLPSGGKFSWKTQDRKEHFVEASSSRVLRRSKAKEMK